jgi:hypothetical protein
MNRGLLGHGGDVPVVKKAVLLRAVVRSGLTFEAPLFLAEVEPKRHAFAKAREHEARFFLSKLAPRAVVKNIFLFALQAGGQIQGL